MIFYLRCVRLDLRDFFELLERRVFRFAPPVFKQAGSGVGRAL